MAQKTWTIEKTIPTLTLPDITAAIDFYARLGFALDWRWPEQDPTHAGLILGETSIMLARCQTKELADIYFIVDDIEACYQSISTNQPWCLAKTIQAAEGQPENAPARAVKPPAPPAPTDYGLRDFSVVDPWGHHLTFGQPLDRDD